MVSATTELSPAREIIAKWYYQELWSWYRDKNPTVEEFATFLTSNLVVANGDG